MIFDYKETMIFSPTVARLVGGCFFLTAIPLCIAIARLAINLNDLASRSEIAVKRAESVGAVSREIRNAGLSVERSVRQAVVLDDPILLEDYQRARASLTRAMQRADALPTQTSERSALSELRTFDGVLATQLAAGLPTVEQRADVVDAAGKISELADKVEREFDTVVSREVQELQASAEKGRSNWPVMVGVAAMLAAVLGLGFSVWVSRPLNSLDRSIRRMGEAKFDTPVTIKGPPDLRSLGERLEWLRQRLHSLESHQANFLRQVSHELKTPLTAIREGTELLNDRVTGELSEGQEEVVLIIRENSQHLQRLINDLLTYQQHRSAVPLKIERVQIPELVQKVVDSHRVPVLAKAISMRVHTVPVSVGVDREKIRVVLDNLLSNAIKYSPSGGQIFIAVRVVHDALQIDVSDQGPGISLADKDRIFESFYQGLAPTQASVKGTGLGLAIARDFVVAHGGDIEVVEAGKPGARLRVRLPGQEIHVEQGHEPAPTHSGVST
jgi:two-component system, NtrC family, sensor histidine kinase GlrK